MKAMLIAYMFEVLASWEASAPAVWTSALGAVPLEVALGVGVGVVECVVLVLEGLALASVLEGLLLLLLLLLLVLLVLLGLGEAFGEDWALGLGEGEGEGWGSPPPKLQSPWRTPADSEPKKSNNPSERSRLLGPQPMHSSTIVA